MNEYEKMRQGYLHFGLAEEIFEHFVRAKDLCFDYNHTRPSDNNRKRQILNELFGAETDVSVVAPFRCDIGFHTHFGVNCFINSYCFLLDCADITFGNNVMLGPYCCICTISHSLDPDMRLKSYNCCKPITIGNNVWLGAGVKVMPGVTIGNNVVVGAGSVVTSNIPDNVVACGTPCRVMREITEADKRLFPVHPEDAGNPRIGL